MKLASKQIPAHLKAPAKGWLGTLIYGADEGQVREYTRVIAQTVVNDPNDPFACVELSEDSLKNEPARLHDELFALNMLGGQRLVVLNASGEVAGKLLADIYEGNAMPEAYLLVCSGELTPRSAIRALFEKHAKLAAMPCYKDESYQIDGMIQQVLRSHNIQAEREAVQYLAANLGSDRQVTRSELDKIALYCGDNVQLTLSEAIDLVGNSAELTLDDLCNAIADGNIRAMDRIMLKLLRENTQPIQIVRGLQRYFIRLHLLASKIKQLNQPADQVINELKPKVFFKQVPVLRKQLNIWMPHLLEAALLMLTKAEQACKETGAIPEAQLQFYAMRIATLIKNAA